jgi:hypothetical protein
MSNNEYPPSSPKCYFDIEIGGRPAGRIQFVLRPDIVPKTADNFLKLCTGEMGMGKQGKVSDNTKIINEFTCADNFLTFFVYARI